MPEKNWPTKALIDGSKEDKVRKKILIFTFIFFSFLCHGEEFLQKNCPEAKKITDMRMQFGPIRTQTMGWCFAHPSADAYMHFLKRKGLLNFDVTARENMISTNFIGLTFTEGAPIDPKGDFRNPHAFREKKYSEAAKDARQTKKLGEHKKNAVDLSDEDKKRISDEIDLIETRHNVRGGNARKALRDLCDAKNICLQSDVPSSDYAGYEGMKFKQLDDIIYESYKDPKSGTKFCQAATVMNKMFPKVDPDILIEQLKKKDPYSHLVENPDLCSLPNPMEKRCPEPRAIVFTPNDPRDKERLDTEFVYIQKMLEENVPTTLAFVTADFLKPIWMQGMSKNGSDGHAALVIGHRFNCETQKNDYLIRNSWGPEACYQLRHKIIAEKGKPQFSCTGDGYFIISQEVLSKHLYETTILK